MSRAPTWGAISIHALCEEGDQKGVKRARTTYAFLSTPSARRATREIYRLGYSNGISIHALCEEGDYGSGHHPPTLQLFLSTPSARRATGRTDRKKHRQRHFYPRPLRGGRLSGTQAFVRWLNISIHALCEEGDPLFPGRYTARENISIHALCEEGDCVRYTGWATPTAFLSTPSARRATISVDVEDNKIKFLSTPSARRAT